MPRAKGANRAPELWRQLLPREPKATFNYCLGLCNQMGWATGNGLVHLAQKDPSLQLEHPELSNQVPSVFEYRCKSHWKPLFELPESQEEQLGPFAAACTGLQLYKLIKLLLLSEPHFPHLEYKAMSWQIYWH